MRFAICNEMFEGWTLEDVFNHAAEAGYDGVEIAPFTMASSITEVSKYRRGDIRRAAEKANVEILGFHWLLLSPEGMYINHPDESIRKTTQEYYLELINCCGDLGGELMINGSPKQRNLVDGVSYQEAWDYSVEFFKGIADTAEKRDVTVCIEPLAPTETDFVNTAQEAIRLAKAVDSSHVKIMLDVKAMSSEESSIPDIIRASKGWFSHFHANDTNLLGPGMGDTDFAPIAQALTEVNYDGWVSVEVFDYSPGPEVIAEKSLSCLKKVFHQD